MAVMVWRCLKGKSTAHTKHSETSSWLRLYSIYTHIHCQFDARTTHEHARNVKTRYGLFISVVQRYCARADFATENKFIRTHAYTAVWQLTLVRKQVHSGEAQRWISAPSRMDCASSTVQPNDAGEAIYIRNACGQATLGSAFMCWHRSCLSIHGPSNDKKKKTFRIQWIQQRICLCAVNSMKWGEVFWRNSNFSLALCIHFDRRFLCEPPMHQLKTKFRSSVAFVPWC